MLYEAQEIRQKMFLRTSRPAFFLLSITVHSTREFVSFPACPAAQETLLLFYGVVHGLVRLPARPGLLREL